MHLIIMNCLRRHVWFKADGVIIIFCDFFTQEIKLSALRAKPADDVPETEQEMAAAVVKKTLVSQAILRSVLCRSS